MGFNPGIDIGTELSNDEMRSLFQCGNMGGMRRSKKTGTLVIISDETKGLYRDVWINGVLHYTGMGKLGNQVLEGNQNGTLYHSDTNGVEVHLFEVFKKAVYTYRGIVKLVEKPYQSEQLDDAGQLRKVWIFPIQPIAEIVLSEKEIVKLTDQELAKRTINKAKKPEAKSIETVVYYRDPYLKEMVKRIAEGKCQYCGNDAPFIDNNGQPYLEEHHVKRLADGGSDTIDNVVAICPNCHRRVHNLNNAEEIVELTDIAKKNKEKMQWLLAYRKMDLSE